MAGGAAATNGAGAFVVVHNVSASHSDLVQFMQIYVVVALAAALLIAGSPRSWRAACCHP